MSARSSLLARCPSAHRERVPPPGWYRTQNVPTVLGIGTDPTHETAIVARRRTCEQHASRAGDSYVTGMSAVSIGANHHLHLRSYVVGRTLTRTAAASNVSIASIVRREPLLCQLDRRPA